jgi:hypothetical protein
MKASFRLHKKTENWALLISAVALLVSVRTWIDTHEQLSLAKGQVRSFVQVTDAKLIQSISDASFIVVQLKLKNFGQTAAVNLYGEMDYDLGTPDLAGLGNEATGQRLGSLGPGAERTRVLRSNRINRRDWPQPTSRGFQTVYFWGTIWYVDDTTRERRKEDWCYQVPLVSDRDLNRTDLDLCEKLTYSSSDKRDVPR